MYKTHRNIENDITFKGLKSQYIWYFAIGIGLLLCRFKQAIINNSDCKILMNQSKYQHRFELVQQLLGLTDKERSIVLSLNKDNDPRHKYKEVFISLGGRYSRVYRVEAPR